MAEGRGLTVFSIEGKRSLALPRLARAGGGFKTTLFSIELLSLLEAGLNLVEALQTLAGKEPAGEGHDVLAGRLAALTRGGRATAELCSRESCGRPPAGSRSRRRWRRFRSTSRRSTWRRSRRASAPAT